MSSILRNSLAMTSGNLTLKLGSNVIYMFLYSIYISYPAVLSHSVLSSKSLSEYLVTLISKYVTHVLSGLNKFNYIS